MDLPIISRVYFDRKPPYQEEAIKRMEGQNVQVVYELEVERVQATQQVNETEKGSSVQPDTYTSSELIQQYVEKLKSDKTMQLTEEHKAALIQVDLGVDPNMLKELL